MATYSLLDIFLGRARHVRIKEYRRATGCRHPIARHGWGNGSWTSYMLAWRTNPSGKQPCGCIYTYGVV